MIKQRYVSLGVALCAALGVHTFVFFMLADTKHVVISDKPLELTILPQEKIKPSAVKQNVTTKTKQQPKNVVAVLKPQAKISIPKPSPPKPQASTSLAKPKPKPVINKISEFENKQTLEQQVQVIPQAIQQRILANIYYPKQAKRRGWEGTAKFSLDVYQHDILGVQMLISTGYKVLDSAAQKGIASIKTLPLHDGKHVLPVTFRLQ